MYRSYVAIGDSFTEGLDDPAGDGTYRGWADRVAERIAADDPGFRYANLAVRGRLLDAVVAEQVPAVAAMRPELVSIAAGGNDVLRRSCDADDLGRRMRQAVQALAATSGHVVVFAGFDPFVLPTSTGLTTRIRTLNDACRAAAAEVGGTLVDLWQLPVLADRRMWSVDRLHLSSEGHRRVAGVVLDALGYPDDTGWATPLEAAAPQPWLTARGEDAAWAWRHLRPWLLRRLRGQSSGDAVLAKRPELELSQLSDRGSATPRG